MNRKIKFRMWNDYDKKMIYWNELLESNLANIFTMSQYSRWLMQYTGLHDKYGKEIYEGDILKSIQWNDIYLVKYIGTAFYLCRKRNNRFNKITTWNNAEKSEVIGNIYDNPELLGGE